MTSNSILTSQDKKVHIAMSAVRFYPTQKVRIIEPNIEAVVNVVKVSVNGVMYDVQYWNDKTLIQLEAYEYEIESMEDNK
jgi:hypothetical protein